MSQEFVCDLHRHKNSHAIVSHDIFIAIVNGCPFKMSTSCIVDMFMSLRRLIFKFQWIMYMQHWLFFVACSLEFKTPCVHTKYVWLVSIFRCFNVPVSRHVANCYIIVVPSVNALLSKRFIPRITYNPFMCPSMFISQCLVKHLVIECAKCISGQSSCISSAQMCLSSHINILLLSTELYLFTSFVPYPVTGH